MQIRAAQMLAIEQATEKRFQARVVRLLREEEDPEARDPDVPAKCRELVARARALGLATEFEIAVYAMCGCVFGTDFDSRSDLPFRRILHEPGTEPRLKAAQMAAVLEQSEREDA